MNVNRSFLLAFAIFLMAPFSSTADSFLYGLPPAREFADRFLAFQDGVTGNTLSRASIDAEANALLATMGSLAPGSLRFFWEARVFLVSGHGYASLKDKKKAEGYFLQAVEAAKKANASGSGSKSATVWALAEAKTQLMLVRGFPGIIVAAPEAEKLVGEALSLDSRNAKAIILKAYGKLNAPEAFGGNPKTASESLLPLVAYSALEKTDIYLVYCGLAQAYGKVGKESPAREYAEKARDLYPTGILVSEIMVMLK